MIIGLISILYFTLFIPINLQGAKDANMLSVFRIDEFGLYPTVMHMTTLGSTPLETLKNVLITENYTYGYPFWLTSALAILPFRLLEQAFGLESQTTIHLLILRQLSVAFALCAIWVLVYLWTGFRSAIKSVALFLFLGLMPAVFLNNMWWHPDSLTTLFVVVTIYCLVKDNLRFDRYFYLAAIFCGLTAGTKLIGVFFFLAIWVYLFLGYQRDRGLITYLKRGVKWGLVAAATMIASNPLVVIPMYLRRYVESQQLISGQYRWGWGVAMDTGPLSWYSETLRDFYGYWWLFALVVILSTVAVQRISETRLLNLVVLAWAIPFSVYLLFVVAHKNYYYFIPIVLPLFSCLCNLWSSQLWKLKAPRTLKMGLALAVLLLLGVQTTQYISADISTYVKGLNKEQQSPALQFYEQLESLYLSKLPEPWNLVVFREPYVYVPATGSLLVHFKWDSTDYSDIEKVQPDLLLIERSNVKLFEDPSIVVISQDRLQAQKSFEFYSDVKHGAPRGFEKIFETDFGIAFVRH